MVAIETGPVKAAVRRQGILYSPTAVVANSNGSTMLLLAQVTIDLGIEITMKLVQMNKLDDFYNQNRYCLVTSGQLVYTEGD
jgi:hypothetical protein